MAIFNSYVKLPEGQMEVILGISITITTTIHHAILIFPSQKTVDTCASLMEQYSNHS